MKTLGRNTDNDLYLEGGGLAILHDADAQCAIIESVLQTQQGELPFAEDQGIDYFGTVLQNPNTIRFWAAQVRSRIEELDFVAAVEDFVYEFDKENSTLLWSMTVVNTDNERLDLRNKKTVLESSPGVNVQWDDIYDKPQGTDEVLKTVAAMKVAADGLRDGLTPRSTLAQVKETLNKVLYDSADEEYARRREITFSFEGIPLGTVIKFENLVVGIADTAPFVVEFSDGTRQTIFPDEGSTTSHIYLLNGDEKIYTHTIVTSGAFSITLRGDFTGIYTASESLPIFTLVRNNSVEMPFPYFTGFALGDDLAVAEIGENTFRGLVNLKNISWATQALTSTEVTIGRYAFADCSGIGSLTWLPPKVTSIGEGGFSGCSGLATLQGLEVQTLEEIPEKCFENCSSLASLEGIPQSVTKIGESAFAGCTAISDLSDLPDSITELGASSFEGCRSIETILCLPGSLESIGDDCFKGCTGLSSLYLPPSLTAIGSDAFHGCGSLTNVLSDIADPSIIDDSAFELSTGGVLQPIFYVASTDYSAYCDEFGEEYVKKYGVYKFTLTDVAAGTTLLGETGILSSDSIWGITFGDGGSEQRFTPESSAVPGHMYEAAAESISIVIRGYITEVSAASENACPFFAINAGNTFAIMTGIEFTDTPLAKIGDYTFKGCSNLASASVSSSADEFLVGASAFESCQALTSLAWLPASLKEFGARCFTSSGVVALDYPNANLTALPDYCFAYTSIEKLDGIGSGITSLGEHCFTGCSLLEDIQELAGTGISEIPNYCFSGCTKLTSLAGIGKIVSIGDYAFTDCGLTSIQEIDNRIGASNAYLRDIGRYAFANCSIVSLAGFNDNLESIGEGCFSGCHVLQSIEGWNSLSESLVAYIPARCFQNCRSLKTLKGCERVISIGDYAFSGCTGLITTTGLGFEVRQIGARSFMGCTGLNYVSIATPFVPEVSSSAFEGVSISRIPLYVREGMTGAFSSASVWSSFASVSSRVISIQFVGIEGFNAVEGQTIGSRTYIPVNCTIASGVTGVWYIDYGDGTFDICEGSSIPSHSYAVRGNYDVTLFGDIVGIESPDGSHPLFQDISGSMTNIEISSPMLAAIGDSSFRSCGSEGYSLDVSVTMADSGVIGDDAFAGAHSVVVEKCNAVEVGDCAFKNCGLVSSSAFNSLTKAGEEAFSTNPLADLRGFTGLSEAGNGVFGTCTALTSTSGLSMLGIIPERAFTGCTGLTTVRDLSTKLTEIKANAFEGCNNISTVFMANETPPPLANSGFTTAVYDNADVYVPAGKENDYYSTNFWNLFEKGIHSRAIAFQTSRINAGTRISKGYGLITAYGNWTISYGEDEQTIAFTSGTGIELPAYVFQHSHPDGVTIKISGPVTGIMCTASAYPIFGGSSFIEAVDASAAMEIATIGAYTFAGSSKLASIHGLSQVTEVGANAFANNTSLVDISGLTNLTTIGDSAFSGCSKITSLDGLSNVTTIGVSAFNGCSALRRIDGLGLNVASIGTNAFSSCPLEEVQMFADNPPTMDGSAFGGLDLSSVPLYVRSKSESAYRSDANWGAFANIRSRYIEFALTACPDNITVLSGIGKVTSDTFWTVEWTESGAIGGDRGTDVPMDGFTFSTSGDHVFRLEGAVTAIKGSAPNSFLTIQDGEDSPINPEDHYLTRVSKSEYSPIVGIGDCSFASNYNLASVSLPGITSIGDRAFYRSGIESLELLNNVTEIGEEAFFECRNINAVNYLNAAPLTIGLRAFGRGADSPSSVPQLESVQTDIARASQAIIVIEPDPEVNPDGPYNTSFGYFENQEAMKGLQVFVPITSVAEYESSLWGYFSVSSRVISFTMENVPEGTTIIGSGSQDSVGTAKIISNSAWSVDWGDGTRSTMSSEDTTFPEHTYEYNEANASLWATRTTSGQTMRYIPYVVVSISGDITSIGCQSATDYPLLATTRRSDNPYLTRIQASQSLENLEAIGAYAFKGCTTLSAVSGFTNVKAIEQSAFEGCSNLQSLGGAASGFAECTSIGELAFAGCTRLPSLEAFPSVLTIGLRAFANCISLPGTRGLGDAYKGWSIEDWDNSGLSAEFSAYAFEGCQYGSIDMYGYNKPPIIQETTFPGTYSTMMVFVNGEVLSVYQDAPIWKNYWPNIIATNPISITFGVNQIHNGDTFYGSNAKLMFSGQRVVIDWGDGTSSTSMSSSSGDSGWIMPDHTYTDGSGFVDGSAVTITIQGKISQILSADGTHPCIGIIPSGGTSANVTYQRKIDTLKFGKGSNLSTIGNNCFRGCNIGIVELGRPATEQEVSENEGLIALGNYAFYGCTNLNDVVADGNALATIGDHAFENCSNIISLDFISGVTAIGQSAFKGCAGLPSIHLPATLTSLGNSAFEGCENIGNEGIVWEVAEEGAIPAGTTITLGSSAFKGCTGVSITFGIDIRQNVTSIGDNAFRECGAATVSLPDTVTALGAYCFAGCNNLTNVVVPSSVSSLGEGCFNCSHWIHNYETLNLAVAAYTAGTLSDLRNPATMSGVGPTTITWIPSAASIYIGSGCFMNCTRLSSIVNRPEDTSEYTAPSISSIPDYVFFNCRLLPISSAIVIPNSVTRIGNYAFAYCESLYSLPHYADTLPNNFSIGQGVFKGCTNLSSIVGFPAVEVVPAETFMGCTSIEQVEELPDSVTTLGKSCFESCTGIFDVDGLPNVSAYGERCFADCTNIRTIVGEENISGVTLTDGAFAGCRNITFIQFPWHYIVGRNPQDCDPFSGLTDKSATSLDVPPDMVTIYQEEATHYWRQFNIVSEAGGTKKVQIGVEIPAEGVTMTFIPRAISLTQGGVGSIVWGDDSQPTILTSSVVSNEIQHTYASAGTVKHLTIELLGDVVGITGSYSGLPSSTRVQTIKCCLYSANEQINEGSGIYVDVYSNDHIESVRVLDKDVELGQAAFAHCSKLTSMEVTDDMSQTKLGDGLFRKSSLSLGISGSFPNTTALGMECFKGTSITDLTCLSSASGLNTIDTKCFEASRISTLNWMPTTNGQGATITYTFGTGAFLNCRNLVGHNSIARLASVKCYNNRLPTTMFQGCQNIGAISKNNLPQNLSRIGSSCFFNCSLSEIENMPSSLTLIEDTAFALNNIEHLRGFESCTNLTQIGQSGGKVFQSCALRSLEGLPSSVTSLSVGCFYKCGSLEDISGLANTNLSTLPNQCFAECEALKSLNGIERITNFGQQCFYKCSALTALGSEVDGQEKGFGHGVVSLGAGCFQECRSLADISALARSTGLSVLPNNCFTNCYEINSLSGVQTIVSFGDSCFSGCRNIGTFVHHDGQQEVSWLNNQLTHLGASCFAGCGLTSLKGLPDSITTIGESCFANCSYISNLYYWPRNFGMFPNKCFYQCRNLASVLFNGGQNNYRNKAIPFSTTNIGEWCFAGSSSIHMASLNWLMVDRYESMDADNPLTMLGEHGLENLDSTIEIYVPAAGLTAYKAHSSWSAFAGNIHAFNTVTLDMNLPAGVTATLYDDDMMGTVVATGIIAWPVRVPQFDGMSDTPMPIGNLPYPQSAGYTFVGWFDAAVGGNQIDKNAAANDGGVYYAHWTTT